MATILGISGSLRAGSYNTMLLRAAKQFAPAGTTIEEGSIRGIPLYDGDLEAKEGLPAAVVALKERIRAADGVLIATPEYNNGVPGVLKNAIDWLSRPASEIAALFGGKPFGVIGASAGPGGTNMAQVAWLPTLRLFNAQLWMGARVAVGTASKVFDDKGEVIDAKVREQLEKYITGFAKFVSRKE